MLFVQRSPLASLLLAVLPTILSYDKSVNKNPVVNTSGGSSHFDTIEDAKVIFVDWVVLSKCRINELKGGNL